MSSDIDQERLEGVVKSSGAGIEVRLMTLTDEIREVTEQLKIIAGLLEVIESKIPNPDPR